jgi:hypothetical protein
VLRGEQNKQILLCFKSMEDDIMKGMRAEGRDLGREACKYSVGVVCGRLLWSIASLSWLL